MILTLNDKLEESKYYKPQEKKELVEQLTNAKYDYLDKKNYKNRVKIQDLFYVEDNMVGDYSHKNYMEYLFGAWDAHWGIVVSPDIIWYTLQNELTGIVATNAETYRDLFTTSKDKQEITVQSGSLTVMPLDTLMAAIAQKVPSDIRPFLPEFSTSNQRSILARYAAFADMVSPYYNYSMFCCGFPAIDVRGDASDWNKLRASWNNVGKLFAKHQTYVAQVAAILDEICSSLDVADFWRKMFTLDKCGSGHQYTVDGWINKLYLQQPDLAFPENYPSHISLVKYKQLNTQKNYEMKSGLICSKKEGGFLIPEFAHVIYEKVNQPVQTPAERY